MRTLLLGGTDLTLAVATRMRECGIPPVGVVYVGQRFNISYSPRGVNNLRFANIVDWCRQSGVPHRLYEKPAGIRAFASDLGADFCLAAGWYHMVPADLRNVFPLGAAGLHASLLPRLRGGAPLNWAILSGEKETGITLFALGDGIDDGPVYGQERFPIGPQTTIADLVQDAERGALTLVERCLPHIADGTLKPRPQTGEPSYCLQRIPEDGRIDWRRPASDIDRLVRAVSRPYSGAFSSFDGDRVIIWDSQPLTGDPPVFGAAGQIARLPGASAPCVVTGRGLLAIREATDEEGTDVMPTVRRAANRRFEG